MSENVNYYNELSKINVNEHVEKKGKFSYLSWAWAVDVLRKQHPTATWEVVRFDGFPFMQTPLGYFVEVAVTVEGITLSQIHPVLNNQNKPIETPDSFQINTSIQRCLVKAIALHGLGLYIYSGEDLPPDPEAEKAAKEEADNKTRNEIKIKWEALQGNVDGMDKWIDEQLTSGKTLDMIHKAITKRALDKQKENK